MALVTGLCGAATAAMAAPYCAAIASAVDAAAPGSGPVFAASYRSTPDALIPDPVKSSAFSYDNALAAIALVSCGDAARATRIADAFVAAISGDRSFADGRVRNAYLAGAVVDGPAKLPGWWDRKAQRWDEDAYQDGTSTGNVAWVALALLNVGAATGRPEYFRTASRLLAWIAARAADGPGPAGYRGGLSGFDGAQSGQSWKSTEHNIDVAAAAYWASRLTGDPAQAAMARRASAFVATRFAPKAGYFLLGTKSDGSDADPGALALDVQLWPILGVPDAPADWRRSVAYALGHLRQGDGMTFAGIGPNTWSEGTAQAALALRAIGDEATAKALLANLATHVSAGGFLFATSAGEVETGLTIEGGNGQAFHYFHWPHLGATAWAALAEARWNPFTGKRIPQP